jgi:hypothetical protein
VKTSDALKAAALRACRAVHEAHEALHGHEGPRTGPKHQAKAEALRAAVQWAKRVGAQAIVKGTSADA